MLVGGLLVLLLLAWTIWTLTRLSRLEGRVARAWTALDTQLQRRAGLAEELARHYPPARGEGRGGRRPPPQLPRRRRGGSGRVPGRLRRGRTTACRRGPRARGERAG